MKRKTIFRVTMLILLAALVALHFMCGLFTPYNYLTAKWDIHKQRPVFVKYGRATNSDEQAGIIAKKLGFTYDVVTPSFISKPAENGISAYNKEITLYLNSQLGNNWKAMFSYQVDSLFRADREDTMRKTVLAIPDVKRFNHYLDSISSGKRQAYIWVLPQEKKEPNVRVGMQGAGGAISVFNYYKVDPYSLKWEEVRYMY